MDVESTTCCKRLFQSLTTRLLYKNFLTSSLDRCLQTFILCARKQCSFIFNWENWMLLILSFPLSILYISTKSPLVLLLCKVGPKKNTCASSKLVKKMGKEDAGYIFINFFYLSLQDSSAKLHYIFTFFIYILLLKYFNCSFYIYINCLLFAWIELLSKGDVKDVIVDK